MPALKLIVVFMFAILGFSVQAQENGQDQDSVVYQVFHALTLEDFAVSEAGKNAFTETEWEALAYWDTESPKKITEMMEAVGDVYRFYGNNRFEIQLRDPEDGRKFGAIVKGTYRWNGNYALELIPEGNQQTKITWNVVYLTEHYLVLDIEGLRVFFTKEKSWK